MPKILLNYYTPDTIEAEFAQTYKDNEGIYFKQLKEKQKQYPSDTLFNNANKTNYAKTMNQLGYTLKMITDKATPSLIFVRNP